MENETVCPIGLKVILLLVRKIIEKKIAFGEIRQKEKIIFEFWKAIEWIFKTIAIWMENNNKNEDLSSNKFRLI